METLPIPCVPEEHPGARRPDATEQEEFLTLVTERARCLASSLQLDDPTFALNVLIVGNPVQRDWSEDYRMDEYGVSMQINYSAIQDLDGFVSIGERKDYHWTTEKIQSTHWHIICTHHSTQSALDDYRVMNKAREDGSVLLCVITDPVRGSENIRRVPSLDEFIKRRYVTGWKRDFFEKQYDFSQDDVIVPIKVPHYVNNDHYADSIHQWDWCLPNRCRDGYDEFAVNYEVTHDALWDDAVLITLTPALGYRLPTRPCWWDVCCFPGWCYAPCYSKLYYGRRHFDPRLRIDDVIEASTNEFNIRTWNFLRDPQHVLYTDGFMFTFMINGDDEPIVEIMSTGGMEPGKADTNTLTAAEFHAIVGETQQMVQRLTRGSCTAVTDRKSTAGTCYLKNTQVVHAVDQFVDKYTDWLVQNPIQPIRCPAVPKTPEVEREEPPDGVWDKAVVKTVNIRKRHDKYAEAKTGDGVLWYPPLAIDRDKEPAFARIHVVTDMAIKEAIKVRLTDPRNTTVWSEELIALRHEFCGLCLEQMQKGDGMVWDPRPLTVEEWIQQATTSQRGRYERWIAETLSQETRDRLMTVCPGNRKSEAQAGDKPIRIVWDCPTIALMFMTLYMDPVKRLLAKIHWFMIGKSPREMAEAIRHFQLTGTMPGAELSEAGKRCAADGTMLNVNTQRLNKDVSKCDAGHKDKQEKPLPPSPENENVGLSQGITTEILQNVFGRPGEFDRLTGDGDVNIHLPPNHDLSDPAVRDPGYQKDMASLFANVQDVVLDRASKIWPELRTAVIAARTHWYSNERKDFIKQLQKSENEVHKRLQEAIELTGRFKFVVEAPSKSKGARHIKKYKCEPEDETYVVDQLADGQLPSGGCLTSFANTNFMGFVDFVAITDEINPSTGRHCTHNAAFTGIGGAFGDDSVGFADPRKAAKRLGIKIKVEGKKVDGPDTFGNKFEDTSVVPTSFLSREYLEESHLSVRDLPRYLKNSCVITGGTDDHILKKIINRCIGNLDAEGWYRWSMLGILYDEKFKHLNWKNFVVRHTLAVVAALDIETQVFARAYNWEHMNSYELQKARANLDDSAGDYGGYPQPENDAERQAMVSFQAELLDIDVGSYKETNKCQYMSTADIKKDIESNPKKRTYHTLMRGFELVTRLGRTQRMKGHHTYNRDRCMSELKNLCGYVTVDVQPLTSEWTESLSTSKYDLTSLDERDRILSLGTATARRKAGALDQE